MARVLLQWERQCLGTAEIKNNISLPRTTDCLHIWWMEKSQQEQRKKWWTGAKLLEVLLYPVAPSKCKIQKWQIRVTIKGYFTEASFLQQHKVLRSITLLLQEILCWVKSYPQENRTLCSNTRSYFINEAVLWQKRKLQSLCVSSLKEHVMNLRQRLRSSADPGKQAVRGNWDLCGFRAAALTCW